MTENSNRERIERAVELLEAVLDGEGVDGQARHDLSQARDYAAGSLPILDHNEPKTDGGVEERDSERKVIQTAECEAPSCGFVAVVEDPETQYDAAKEVVEHLNEDHDEIDRELAAYNYPDWEPEGGKQDV